MHITYTPAKGKTIDKNADAFIDLTVIFANGNVSGKRVEITTKNFAKNLGALYSQLSRQENLNVENESSHARVLHEILIKSVEEDLNKENLIAELTKILPKGEYLQSIKMDYANLKKALGNAGASQKAAELMLKLF